MSEAIHETLKHIRRVQELLQSVVENLMFRARHHDESKLSEPEASVFDRCTKQLAGLTYGSDEYKQCLADMGPALQHHYQMNRHHPEHWQAGVKDMSLLDLIEMLVDWKAASERHNNGSIARSLDVNQERFQYSHEVDCILRRTVLELWPEHRESWHCFSCGNGGASGYYCEMCGAGRDDYKPRGRRIGNE